MAIGASVETLRAQAVSGARWAILSLAVRSVVQLSLIHI